MKTTSIVTARQSSRLARLSHIVMGAWAMAFGMATSANLGLVQMMEFQVHSLFFELRGSVAPTENIVILAIDELSLSQEQYYRTDPEQYAYLEPLQAWPWKRTAYAGVIERLMAAGARSVALNILFTTPSSYGTADDEQLAHVLQRHAGRVTLASVYQDVETREGEITQLHLPERLFWTSPMSIGSVNFPLEADGKIHRLASEFPKLLAEKYQEQQAGAGEMPQRAIAVPYEGASPEGGSPSVGNWRWNPDVSAVSLSFDEAAVAAAQRAEGKGARLKVKANSPSPSSGDHIYFYGPKGTFEQIPFWHVLDPDNWNSYLQQGKYFKDKIVLIGGTAASLQDFHGVPFSKSWLYPEPMSGVEIHANAIASLLEGRTIRQAIPNRQARGLFVLLFVAGTAVLQTLPKRALTQFIWAIGIPITWGGISYLSFVYGKLILPTAVPVVAIALGGVSYLGTGAVRESLRKRQLRSTLERHLSFPVVQKIVSQQDDLQDLLQKRELARFGKIIGGRYKIVKVLASGGFSETYIAEDNQRPGKPLCVVKQLRLANNDLNHLQLARRLFHLEAETLEKLGKHNQIPRLFAYFEEDEEFYLVQELIVGHPLNQELQRGKPILEAAVIQILHDLLQILEFVHNHEVIHRDIKPRNIIRRHSDGKLVLIDFGAVKEVSTQLHASSQDGTALSYEVPSGGNLRSDFALGSLGLEHEGQTGFTIGIGTQGYAPSEQYAGRVRFSSDIYAVGMTGIKALTGLDPHELQLDSKSGEFIWTHKAQVSPYLAAVLSKMVRYDFTQRYQSASEALEALEELVNSSTEYLALGNLSTNTLSVEDLDTPTAPWVGVTAEIPESPSSTSSLPPHQ